MGIEEWLHDVARWFKSPIEQRDVWKDYRNTRKRAEKIREDYADIKPGKTVLVVSVDSPIYEVKQMAMLLVGLQRAGWKPMILLNDAKQRWHRRYYSAYGLDSFIYWSDFNVKVTTEAGILLPEEVSFQDVKQWAVDGCWIGPQILASISRSTFRGAPDLQDPAVYNQLRDRLEEVLPRISVAQTILKHVQPHLMLIIEANYAKYAPMTDLAVL